MVAGSLYSFPVPLASPLQGSPEFMLSPLSVHPSGAGMALRRVTEPFVLEDNTHFGQTKGSFSEYGWRDISDLFVGLRAPWEEEELSPPLALKIAVFQPGARHRKVNAGEVCLVKRPPSSFPPRQYLGAP